MTPHRRQRVLALLIAPMATAVIYVNVWAYSASDRIAALEKELPGPGSAGVDPALELAVERRALTEERKRAGTAQLSTAAAEAELDAIAGALPDGTATAATVEHLNGRLVQHGLHVLDDGPADRSRRAMVPRTLEALRRPAGTVDDANATALPTRRAPQVWRVRLQGRYLALLAALESLAADSLPVVPLAVEMAPTNNADAAGHEWTLWFWI